MSITLNSRLRGLISRLPEYASKSSLSNQHGAVLIRNGSPYMFSYNKIIGHKTVHAECDVIRRFLISQGIRCFEKESRLLWGYRKQ